MEHVSFINTCGQIHVPINLSKCCATASARLIISLHRADGILLSVRNYMTTRICTSYPFLVCWGSGWTSPTSNREVTNVTLDLTCRGSMISAEARFQIEGTGCPDRLLGRGPAAQAVKRSCGLPHISPALHLF